MRGLMRMLMMFGPLIYRQYQKYQRNKVKTMASENEGGKVDREQENYKREDTDGDDSYV